MVVNPPSFGWGFWMDVAAGKGVNYFDANMNPGINSKGAVEALDMYKRIIDFSGPGGKSMDIGQTIQRWQSGADVMSVWWIDLAEFTVQQQGMERAEQQGADIVPGWEQPDGSINHKAISLWCRTGSIPKNIPQDRKDAACHCSCKSIMKNFSGWIVWIFFFKNISQIFTKKWLRKIRCP